MIAAALTVCAALAAHAHAHSAKVTPIQKVLEMMQTMIVKGQEEMHNEQVQFAAYKQFCEDTSIEKQRAIKDALDEIEVLEADIEKATADAAKLTKDIKGLETDVSTWTKELANATKVRKDEKADFMATQEDYASSVAALGQAIQVLEKQLAAGEQKLEQTDLVQVASLASLHFVPDETKQAITAFVAREDPGSTDDLNIPEAPVYESSSGSIVKMLEELEDKFKSELTKLEKEEAEAAHSYAMLKADLENQIGAAKEDVESKTEEKAKSLQTKAKKEGDLQDTVSTKEADSKYLADLVATCEQKGTDFESRQALRQEELEALAKAKSIISSEEVAGSGEKYLPSLIQTQKRALAQLRTSVMSSSQVRAMKLLQNKARQFKSKVLANAAQRAADDPFVKVRKMIKDLLVRLMEEANDEAEHKGWCDTELATNKQTRTAKTEAVETLTAESDELEASIAKLSTDIVTLSESIAELDKAMANATALREDEKKENSETIADAQAAQTAVASALSLLKEFYARAGEATSLVQQEPPEPPMIFDSPYKGMQGTSGGVIGMLEVIQSDFARLEADTKASEVAAQKEYDEFMTDSTVDKETKTTGVEHKTAKKQDQTQALTLKKTDLRDTQRELNAAMAYFEKLKPSCIDAGVSYEDRVARRKDEIESLQDALRILNGEDIA